MMLATSGMSAFTAEPSLDQNSANNAVEESTDSYWNYSYTGEV